MLKEIYQWDALGCWHILLCEDLKIPPTSLQWSQSQQITCISCSQDEQALFTQHIYPLSEFHKTGLLFSHLTDHRKLRLRSLNSSGWRCNCLNAYPAYTKFWVSSSASHRPPHDACLNASPWEVERRGIISSRSMSLLRGELEASLGYVKPWWEAGGWGECVLP